MITTRVSGRGEGACARDQKQRVSLSPGMTAARGASIDLGECRNKPRSSLSCTAGRRLRLLQRPSDRVTLDDPARYGNGKRDTSRGRGLSAKRALDSPRDWYHGRLPSAFNRSALPRGLNNCTLKRGTRDEEKPLIQRSGMLLGQKTRIAT
jgi:hypothetical protein